MTTETSVTLEFMSTAERESFTASPANFAKAEEIEELISDAYPTNSYERPNELKQSFSLN